MDEIAASATTARSPAPTQLSFRRTPLFGFAATAGDAFLPGAGYGSLAGGTAIGVPVAPEAPM